MSEDKKKESVTVSFNYTLHVDCPECKREFDLVDHDHDSVFSRAIFNNAWDDLNGESIDCPYCDCEFLCDEIEY